jgi:UDP-glucuronate decarboxylase
VITGAGGWIGLATLDLLHVALGDQFGKRVRAFGSSTRVLRLNDGTQVLQRPLGDLAWLPHEPTIVLHTAFLTKDRAGDHNPAAIGDQRLHHRGFKHIGVQAYWRATTLSISSPKLS